MRVLCFYGLHTSMQKIKILTMVFITILTSGYGYSGSGSDAFASHGSNAIACEADGYEVDKMIPSAKNYMKCVKK